MTSSQQAGQHRQVASSRHHQKDTVADDGQHVAIVERHVDG